MKEIRKGNDIVVTWSLKREGEPFVLEGLSLTLYLKSMYDKKPLSDYSVSGNKIIWTFYGKDQIHTGNYSLELVVNKDEKGMMTTDACNFVRIVSCSCRTSNGWDDCGIKTEVVDIESEVEYGGSIIVVDKVLSPDSENAIANSAVWNGLKQVKDSIPSLSEYAKKEDIHTPDWNAGEGEEGHIKNRTHYADFVEVDIPEDIASSEVELTIPNIVGAPILVHYATLNTSKYLKISANDKELHVLSYGPAFKIRRGDGNTIFISGHNFEDHRLYIATHFVALNEIFLPETIARKSEIQSKLTELEEEIESNGVLIEDLQNMKIDKENDDYYPKMAVGLADNLAGVDVVDSEINFRRSGGGAISDGVARIESIKGNSVVWNQLFERGAIRSDAGAQQYYDEATGEMVINGTITTGTQYAGATIYGGVYSELVIGHKYLTIIRKTSGIYSGTTSYVYLADSGRLEFFTGATERIGFWDAKSDCLPYSIITFKVGDTFNNLRYIVRNYDLTKMFGAGNEPTTIEEFYARIPMGVDLNAYNEGEVIHMDVQSIESQGVNAFDEAWEQGRLVNGEVNSAYSNMITSSPYLRILPNANYYALLPDYEGTANYLYPCYYDEDKVFIAQENNGVRNSTFTTLANAHYMRFFLFNASDKALPLDFNGVCINISDTSINGNYYPYIKRVEDLSIIRKYFPDGMKSAGTAHDEIRYNKASGKWEKVVRIGVVDMGTMEVAVNNATEYIFTTLPANYKAPNSLSATFPAICAPFNSVSAIEADTQALTDCIYGGNNWIIVRPSKHSDLASFKAAMQGVMLYYEIAEPIVTELDEADQYKDFDIQVWNGGTEKANAEGKSAPFAADITYGFNAIGKIKELEEAIKALQTNVSSLQNNS